MMSLAGKLEDRWDYTPRGFIKVRFIESMTCNIDKILFCIIKDDANQQNPFVLAPKPMLPCKS